MAAVASAGASGLLLDEASRGRGGEQVVFVDFRDCLVDLGVATGQEVVVQCVVVVLVLARVA